MKRIAINFLLSLTLIFGCSEKKTVATISQNSNFNAEASEAFLRDFANSTIAPFNKSHECVLRESIKNDLDEIEIRSTLLPPSFEFRRYWIDYLGFDFFFANNGSNRFYFIAFPELREALYDVRKYNHGEDGLLHPNDSCAILKISTSYLDVFLENEAQSQNLDKIITILFQERFQDRITPEEFFKNVSNVTIHSKFFPELSETLRNSKRAQWIFDMKKIGFIVISENTFHKFDMYFIPYDGRGRGITENRTKYTHCLE